MTSVFGDYDSVGLELSILSLDSLGTVFFFLDVAHTGIFHLLVLWVGERMLSKLKGIQTSIPRVPTVVYCPHPCSVPQGWIWEYLESSSEEKGLSSVKHRIHAFCPLQKNLQFPVRKGTDLPAYFLSSSLPVWDPKCPVSFLPDPSLSSCVKPYHGTFLKCLLSGRLLTDWTLRNVRLLKFIIWLEREDTVGQILYNHVKRGRMWDHFNWVWSHVCHKWLRKL